MAMDKSFYEIKKKTIIIDDEKSEEKQKGTKEKPKMPTTPKVYKPYVPKYLVKAKGDDANKYDFVAERPPGYKAKFPEALAHQVSTSLGAFLVCLNELYVRNGLIGSAITNVVLSCIMSYCLYSITRSVQKVYGITQVPQMTYPDLAQATFDISSFPALKKYGGKFKRVVLGFIVARYIAKCCVYQISWRKLFSFKNEIPNAITGIRDPQVIMARSLVNFLNNKNPDLSNHNIRMYLAMLFIPSLLICMLTTTEYTAPYYCISQLYMLFLGAYAVGVGTVNPPNAFTSYPIFSNLTSFFSLCGGCAFAMDSSTAILTIENDMEAPRKIYLLIVIGMSIVTVLMVVMGIVGSYGYGYGTRPPITLNFASLPYAKNFRTGMFFVTYLTFSIEFWVFFNLLWIHIKKRHREERYWIFERLYRAGFVLAITSIALAFPDVSGLLSFFGAIIVGVLNFIFPPFMEFLVDVRYKGFGKFKWKLIRLVAITFFGMILIIGGALSGAALVLDKVFGI